MMNKQDFKKYAIGFVVALVFMAIIRVIVASQGSGVPTEANLRAPREESSGLAAPKASGAFDVDSLWYYTFGITHYTSSVRVLD